jgi:hypothetical protein
LVRSLAVALIELIARQHWSKDRDAVSFPFAEQGGGVVDGHHWLFDEDDPVPIGKAAHELLRALPDE